MKWAKQSEHVAVSDSTPQYRVARFVIDGDAQYRASVRGEFIGAVTTDPHEAQAVCERHYMVTGGEERECA
ncbi:MULTISPECIES: hypothetical protein [unclassified Pseudomonas]|uniref:hypothetical protein n=1 Tax=unclassified Pseudomonas TaxID=196821 RepID=UPI0024481026|nr:MULTISPECIES: hypothetical protein [unclassified Pseudomonas]MDG9927435.1 hypothetical protein [Pseudomonas sp. GD04042]MDH0482504.1 hypothetical protein [Pseudomonas sp. GD04015]MDH0602856.1 hypothetical protein [Pseudomonas sp. GD03869]